MRITINNGQIDVRYISKKIGGFAQPDVEDCMEEKLQVGVGQLVHIGISNHGECDDYETAQ
jgi:hypothetical protein